MSELVHEGKKYQAKDIPGFGMSFVPIPEPAKKRDMWDDFLSFKNVDDATRKYRIHIDNYLDFAVCMEPGDLFTLIRTWKSLPGFVEKNYASIDRPMTIQDIISRLRKMSGVIIELR